MSLLLPLSNKTRWNNKSETVTESNSKDMEKGTLERPCICLMSYKHGKMGRFKKKNKFKENLKMLLEVVRIFSNEYVRITDFGKIRTNFDISRSALNLNFLGQVEIKIQKVLR